MTRLGNVVFDPATHRPRAVLDWDMASVGPAEMDLAWFLGLEGLQVELTGMTVAGFGDRDAVIAPRTGPGGPMRDLEWHETFALAWPQRWRPACGALRAGRAAVDVPRVRTRPSRPPAPHRMTTRRSWT